MKATINVAEARPFSNGSEAMWWEEHNCARCTLARPGDWMDGSDVPCPLQQALWFGYITGNVPTSLAAEYGAETHFQSNWPGARIWRSGEGMGLTEYVGKLPDTDAEPVESFIAFAHMPADCPKRVPGEPS